MKKFIKIVFLLLLCVNSKAQNNILTLEQFIEQVKQQHPVAKQTNIIVEKAKANLLTAKGGFDPTITFEAARKTFDDKNYYFYTNPELKVPLPVGDIKTGMEHNGGGNLSSELTTGRSSYLGFEVPLAKGLLFDKRRATLQQAKVITNQSQQEKLLVLNDLLFDAYQAYVQWQGAFELYNVFSNYVNISQQRLRLLRIANKNGDRSVMDTIEAYTQLQNFEIMQSQALLQLNNTKFEVSNFIWINDSAYQINPNINPSKYNAAINLNNEVLENIITNANTNNPTLKYYNYKIDLLQIDQKLKKQSLLPTLNAKANILNKDYNVLNGFNGAFIQNNYKWGIDFKLPLFLREARGEYKQAQLKIKETNLEITNKRQQIENKIRSYYNEFSLLQQQLNTANSAYNNFNSLYKNELLRFNNGESSLFLVNSRENKTFEYQQKIIELQIKLHKAKYAVDWAAGVLR